VLEFIFKEILCILIYIANQLSNYRSVPGKKNRTGKEDEDMQHLVHAFYW